MSIKLLKSPKKTIKTKLKKFSREISEIWKVINWFIVYNEVIKFVPNDYIQELMAV